MNGSPGPVANEGSGVPWLLAPLVALVGWWTLKLGGATNPWCFLDFVNLAFHEAGHLFFRPFGSTLHYLGGTLGQLLVPALLCGYFLLKQRHAFSAALCAWWVGESLVNVSRYMGDARSLELPLVGGGDHDWNELFYRFGLLAEPSVARVATTTHRLGVVVMLAALAWCGYFLLPSHPREAVRARLQNRFPALAVLLE